MNGWNFDGNTEILFIVPAVSPSTPLIKLLLNRTLKNFSFNIKALRRPKTSNQNSTRNFVNFEN